MEPASSSTRGVCPTTSRAQRNMKSMTFQTFALFLYSCSVLRIECTGKVLAPQSGEHTASHDAFSQSQAISNSLDHPELLSPDYACFEYESFGQAEEGEEHEEDADPIDDFSSATDLER